MEQTEILNRCDHTLLRQDATWEQIRQLCDDGVRYGCASVCIPPSFVAQAAQYLAGALPVCTVIGFPNGYCTTAVKCFEAATAVADGAQEIDMVIHLGWVKEGRYDAVQAEIEAIRRVCRGQTLKVIIETCLLTEAEKVRLCQVVTDAGGGLHQDLHRGLPAAERRWRMWRYWPPCGTGRTGQGLRRHCRITGRGSHAGSRRRAARHQPCGGRSQTKGRGENLIMSNHIAAKPGEIAKTVLMPGDPLRSKYIAEHYLENARLVNNIRGVQGYTGTCHGFPVTVMASGMGIPSIGIYSHELYGEYGVQTIIRIGSAGAISDQVKLRDLVVAMGTCTSSNFAAQFELPGVYAPIADWQVLRTTAETAEALHLPLKIGNVLSQDEFYDARPDVNARWKRMGVLAVEMEAAGLYLTAARHGRQALAICTISDDLNTGEKLSPEERETGFSQMMELALQVAGKLHDAR